MKRLNVLIAVSILAAMVLALVASIPVLADEPIGKPNGKPDEFYTLFIEQDGIDETLCEFDIPYHYELHLVYKMSCNPASELCGDSYHYGGFKQTMTYNDHTMIMHGNNQYRFTFLTGTETIIEVGGGFMTINLPGHGIVYGTVGRQVYLETCPPDCDDETCVCEYEALHWSGMVFDDPETVCNYMATGE